MRDKPHNCMATPCGSVFVLGAPSSFFQAPQNPANQLVLVWDKLLILAISNGLVCSVTAVCTYGPYSWKLEVELTVPVVTNEFGVLVVRCRCVPLLVTA